MVTCRDCCRCPPNNALPLAHSPFTFLITNCLDEANWDLIVWQPRLLVSLQAIFLRFHAVCSSNRFSTKLYAPAVDTTAHFSLLCSHHHHSLWWVSHLIASKRIFSLLRSFRSFFFCLLRCSRPGRMQFGPKLHFGVLCMLANNCGIAIKTRTSTQVGAMAYTTPCGTIILLLTVLSWH